MQRRNLLLCFDAFGTLFRPRQPIEQQYGIIARQCGLSGFTDEQVKKSFRSAMSAQSREHPNYGRQSAMGATQWWENVIHATFKPLLPSQDADLPASLAPRLIERFASKEGYALTGDLPAVLRALRRPREHDSSTFYDRVVIGVITNSDNRVTDVLSSLGLNVSPLRFSAIADATEAVIDSVADDINFVCTSYDVGHEKPSACIFSAAEALLARTWQGRRDIPAALAGRELSSYLQTACWDKVYVGDDFEEDVVGALRSGWHPLFLSSRDEKHRELSGGIKNLNDCAPQPFSALYRQHAVLKISDLEVLAYWLKGQMHSNS